MALLVRVKVKVIIEEIRKESKVVKIILVSL